MRVGRWSKALWLAAVLPLFAASVLPTHLRTLICRFTGAVMEVEACCPADRDANTPVHAQLLDENCCVVKTVDLAKLVSDRRSEVAPSPDIAPLAVALAPAAALSIPLADVHSRPVGPPLVGPPLILLKRSFLI
jgi:hypothetical protein